MFELETESHSNQQLKLLDRNLLNQCGRCIWHTLTQLIILKGLTMSRTLCALLSIGGFAFALASSPASAGPLANSSFESGFNDWTYTGDWIIQQGGNKEGTGPTPWGWFSAGAKDGVFYAESGPQGNESRGTITSSLTTASNRYLSFWHSSNMSPNHSFGTAKILAADGVEVLATLNPLGKNDSVWREWTFDLQDIGLRANDQFYFSYSNEASWSVIDNFTVHGEALAAAVPEPGTYSLVLAGMALLGVGARRRKG